MVVRSMPGLAQAKAQACPARAAAAIPAENPSASMRRRGGFQVHAQRVRPGRAIQGCTVGCGSGRLIATVVKTWCRAGRASVYYCPMCMLCDLKTPSPAANFPDHLWSGTPGVFCSPVPAPLRSLPAAGAGERGRNASSPAHPGTRGASWKPQPTSSTAQMMAEAQLPAAHWRLTTTPKLQRLRTIGQPPDPVHDQRLERPGARTGSGRST